MVTIYQVGQLVKDAFLSVFSPHNIIQGFLKTDICSLNCNIFGEEEFLSSFVTDRSDPSAEVNSDKENYNKDVKLKRIPLPSPFSPAHTSSLPIPKPSEQQTVLLDNLRPLTSSLVSAATVSVATTSRQLVILND